MVIVIWGYKNFGTNFQRSASIEGNLLGGTTMNTRKLILIVMISLFLTACASPQRSEVAPAEVGFSDEAFSEGAPAPEASMMDVDSSFNTSLVASGERIVIMNASMELVVIAPDESMENISRLADEMGGFVVNANLFKTHTSDGQEVPQASITIRVPAERLEEALARIEAESDRLPLSKNVQSQDITSEYTDLQSRLKNLEAAEAQLIEIMDSANRTEDVLNVFDQLTRVRGEIEVIKGQIQYFEESARLSAISVELIPNEVVQPLTIGGWEPVGVIKNALQSLIGALQGLVNVLIWFALFILPILIVVGVPLYFIIRGLRNWRRRRKQRDLNGVHVKSEETEEEE
jgi:hypothetical protein